MSKTLTAGSSISLTEDSTTVTVAVSDAELAAVAGLTSAANKLPYFTGSGTAALTDLTAAGRALIDDADASAQRTTLGLGSIATQAASGVAITGGSITGITDLAIADGGTGAGTASGARTALGLEIGTNVQAYDPELAALAGVSSAADKVPYFTGSGTADVMTVTTAARTVLDDTTVSAMVDTLGGASSTGTGGLVRTTSPTLVTPTLGVATATSVSAETLTGTTGITSGGNSTAAGYIDLLEDSDNGSNKVRIQAPSTLAADYTLTLPADDGTASQVLTTNGSGTLTWETPAGGGSGDLVKVTTLTASSSAELELTGLSTATYSAYLFVLDALAPATNGASLYCIWGSSGSYTEHLNYMARTLTPGGTSNTDCAGDSDHARLAQTVSSGGSDHAVRGTLTLNGHNDSNTVPTMSGNVAHYTGSARLWTDIQVEGYTSSADYTRIKFYYSSGNIASGKIIVYGYKR